MSWTEEKVNKLKELWGKGKTASQIAEILGGLSRNAVIGKAHRLNLSSKIRSKSYNEGSNQTLKKHSENTGDRPRKLSKSRFKSLLIENSFTNIFEFSSKLLNENLLSILNAKSLFELSLNFFTSIFGKNRLINKSMFISFICNSLWFKFPFTK